MNTKKKKKKIIIINMKHNFNLYYCFFFPFLIGTHRSLMRKKGEYYKFYKDLSRKDKKD